ncbi:MAG TPA: copper resistance protein CopC [Ktedonobacteraceae bacterium]|nr:copper resistance protein CopC [Ktedonobacteraceae bacterium]
MHSVRQQLRLLLTVLLGLSALFVISGTALAQTDHSQLTAHASVLSAIPAIGSTITQAPTTVTVTTAENINPNPKLSNLFVYGPSGEATAKLISVGNAKVSLTNPEQMSVTIKPNPQHTNGVYVVQWITVSAQDGDADSGAFTFTVNTNATAAPSPTPAPTSTTGQTITPTGSSTSGTGGTPIWVSLLIGVVALVVGLSGGLALGWRRSAPSVGAMRKTLK